MNKRWLLVFLAALMLCCTGCGKGNEETMPGENYIEITTEVPASVPGVADNEFDAEGFLEETEATESTDPGSQETEGDNTQGTEPGATVPEDTKPEETKPEATEPEAAKPESSEPESTEPEVTAPSPDVNDVTYEDYINMSPEEQMTFFNQFESMEAFVKWYNEAKAKYDEEHGSVDVGDGDIDMGDIVKP